MKWYEHTVKNDLAVPHCFVKLFHLQQSCGILDSTRWHNSIARIRSKRFLFIWSEKRFLFYKLFTTNPQEESYLPNWLSIFHMLVEEILSPTPFFFSIKGFLSQTLTTRRTAGEGRGHLLFHSTTSTRSRTFRYLYVTERTSIGL